MPRRPARLRLTPLEDRLTPAGGLDPTFGSGGIVTSAPGRYGTRPIVATQPDGHILVVDNSGPHGTRVTRYNVDGSPDADYAGSDLTPGTAPFLNEAAVGPDGKITLAGEYWTALATPVTTVEPGGVSHTRYGEYTPVVVRRNADGTPDASFGTGGVVRFPAQADEPIRQLVVGQDGSVVLAAGTPDGTQGYTAIRLTSAGAIDPTYNPAAAAFVPTSGRLDLTDAAAAPGGGLFLAGLQTAYNSEGRPNFTPVILKLTPSGDLDASFAGDGIWSMIADGGVPAPSDYNSGQQIAVQPDGKLVLAELKYTPVDASHRPYVVATRINADGSQDRGFGDQGEATAVAGGGYAQYLSTALLPDGRIVVASGRYETGDVGVAVLNSDGTPDDYFADGSGVGGVKFGTGRTSVGGVAVSGDRIVLLGTVYTGTAQDFLGLAVLTEGPAALPQPLPTPPRPPEPPEPVQGGTWTPEAPLTVYPLGDPATQRAFDPAAPTPGAAFTVAAPPGTAFTPGGLLAVPADVNGDGTADKVVTDGPTVSVVSGTDGAVLVPAFAPFEASYTGTLNAVLVDVNGDGKAELVVSPDQGGGPVVAVYNADGTERGRFWGIDDPGFRGGVRLAATFTEGVPALVVTAGEGGGPRVAVFDGTTLGSAPRRLVADFFAFEPGQRGGATAVDAGGTIVFAAGPGGGPRVRGLYTRNLARAGAAGTLDGIPADDQPFDKFVGDPAGRRGVSLAVRPTGATAPTESNYYYQSEVTADAGDGKPQVVLPFDMVVVDTFDMVPHGTAVA